jgi:hypothetical protein
MQKIDKTGLRFGKLLVISKENNDTYLCKCDCGVERLFRDKNLCKTGSKSCGCNMGKWGRGINFLGMTRKLLTCTAKLPDDKWEWTCKCGNKIILSGWRKYNIKCCSLSCPELNKERGASHRKPKNRTINEQYNSHIYNAKIRNLNSLQKEDWLKIVFLPCYYCGETDTRNYAKYPAYRKKLKNTLTEDIIAEFEVKMNGVDRLDSTKGYDIENCVPCCGTCNFIKSDCTEEKFIIHITKIYKHYVKGEKREKIL